MREQIDWKEICNLFLYLLLVGVLTFVVVRFVGQRTVVIGSSMEPTLSDGDNLIVDKISYRFKDPKRYDIIVFPYELDQDTYYIKRVIGLPGESVMIDEAGSIYIDGDKLIESYGMEVIQNPGLAKTQIQLGEEEYFVLGDNRNDSMDSRDSRVGLIKRDEVIGKAWLRIYPFDEIGMVVHQ